jgi:hypothetical protein
MKTLMKKTTMTAIISELRSTIIFEGLAHDGTGTTRNMDMNDTYLAILHITGH